MSGGGFTKGNLVLSHIIIDLVLLFCSFLHFVYTFGLAGFFFFLDSVPSLCIFTCHGITSLPKYIHTGRRETECWLQADEQASPTAKDLLHLAEETTASSSSKKKKREVAEEVPGINTYNTYFFFSSWKCVEQILKASTGINIKDTVDRKEKRIGHYIYSKQDEGISG